MELSQSFVEGRRACAGLLCVIVAACGGGSASDGTAAATDAAATEEAAHRNRQRSAPTGQAATGQAASGSYVAPRAVPTTTPVEPVPTTSSPTISSPTTSTPTAAPAAVPDTATAIRTPAPDVAATAPSRAEPAAVAPAAAAPAAAAPAAAATAGALPTIDLGKMPAPTTVSYSTERVQPAMLPIDPTDVGAFRIQCLYSHMAFDDPIVYPGQAGKSHLHTFFGNTQAGAATTAASIASSGNSTCNGGIVNRSGYWVASVIDTSDGAPIAPSGALFYYKLGYRGVKPAAVQDLPAGLRMIAGNASATTPPAVDYESPYRWHCVAPDGTTTRYGFSIPDCGAGNYVGLEVWFPQCWDGVNLDSPDHRSHMLYAPFTQTGCPASHPVALPEISFNVQWRVAAGRSSANWRLSSDAYAGAPGGYSTHGDWFNGWKASTASAFVRNCIRASMDCRANMPGDGTELY